VKVVGITGGIASGKTTATNYLCSQLSAHVFDADKVAREILDDPAVLERVELNFGGSFRSIDGTVDRAKLRECVFASAENRKRLEAIIHPGVLNSMVEKIRGARRIGSCKWLIADVPLLFEVGAEKHCDLVVVVACTRSTQKQRLVSSRGISPGVADQMIAAQLPLEDKMQKAHFVVWSECAIAVHQRQLEALAHRLKEISHV
jgi:dephospho-CoA kinase